ncbi:galactose-1-phosphate uridylyltransferase [Fictibacillus sp. NRS-1165]|uniref:galactose-1-phosphate uridylyltransferase n=1 Tax=Fictibacillus sp. NRS-1165 TaxID=3144463 RepID=UPI003D1B7CB4
MAELRYNPLLKDWTMVAASRQNRPHMPKDFCPFCPGSGKVPDEYEVHLYHNDFPVLSSNPPKPDDVGGGLYQTREAYGKCEVVLYSPGHYDTIPDLSPNHMKKLMDLWTETFAKLDQDPNHEYVMIFENRGEEVGVTMPHPHGQVYAYPFIPLKVKTELEACKEYFVEKQRNLFDDMIAEEKRFGERVLLESEHFIAFIPFFTDYPYGAYIVSKEGKTAMTEFGEEEKQELGNMLQEMVGGMDQIYDKLFPYMMVMHQRPSNSDDSYEDFYRFHIEFYPPLRAHDKLKFNSSSETGGWAAANPTKVEENAEILRQCIKRYSNK